MNVTEEEIVIGFDVNAAQKGFEARAKLRERGGEGTIGQVESESKLGVQTSRRNDDTDDIRLDKGQFLDIVA